MDLALVIFNVGVGLGVLAIGGSVAYLTLQAVPLLRESRALARDARRLTRAADQELRPILAHARQLSSNVEVLSEDVAVKLDRVGDLMTALQVNLDDLAFASPPRRSQPRPVESSETSEDSSDA